MRAPGPGMGNLEAQRLHHRGSAAPTGMRMSQRNEAEADQLAARALHGPATGIATQAPLGQRVVTSHGMAQAGSPLPEAVQRDMEPRFGQALGNVRIHTSGPAAEAARALGANAFALREHIVFGSGIFDPNGNAGRQRLAHELSHVVLGAGGEGVVRRETAQEITARFTDWGGLNLREEALGAYLATLARAGAYGLVTSVIEFLSWSDRDDVAGAMMGAFSSRALITMARVPAAVVMLRRMKDELGDGWGWITAGEGGQVNLLGAVLDDPGARSAWNRTRIGAIKQEAGSDLEALARIFEDDMVIDDGSVASRLQAVLGATEHLVIPGLQTGIEFSDEGFAGDQSPGGSGFRDPHPSSRNQPGHFLTAVGLETTPATVSRAITGWGLLCAAIQAPPEVTAANTIRAMVQAPPAMSDSDVALRLVIGHEKVPDPASGLAHGLSIGVAGLLEELGPAPEGETEEQHDQRVGEAMRVQMLARVTSIINTFRTQFSATTEADVAAWNEALAAIGSGDALDMAAAEAPLGRIAIDPAGRGNSIQDLRLSLVGWRLGQRIAAGNFSDGAAVASWIRTNLGAAPSGAAPAPP